MKHKWMKRLICVMLCMALVGSSIYVAYKTPREVEAVAIVDDALIILAILAAAGIGYTGTVVADQDHGKFAQDLSDLDENMKKLYEASFEEWYSVNGDENNVPDFDPDNDDPDKDPPELWEKLKSWIKKNYDKTTGIPLTGALAAVMAQFGVKVADVAKLGGILSYDDQQKAKDNGVILPDNYRDMLAKYPYYAINFYHSVDIDATITTIRMAKKPYAFFKDKFNNFTRLRYQTPGIMPWAEYSSLSGWREFNYDFDSSYTLGTLEVGDYITNCPVFDTQSEAAAYVTEANQDDSKPPFAFPCPLNPTTTLPSTDLSNALANNPDGLTAPLYDNFRLPTEQEVNDYLSNLQNAQNEEEKLYYADDFVHLITNVSPDPKPTPEVTPTPDPGTDPDNPDVTPTPGQDDLTDDQKGLFLLPDGIKKKFPFCIPFDLIDAFSVLKNDSRRAPAVSLPLKSEAYGLDYTMELDLSVYDKQAELLRTMELLLFIVGLVLATRNLIRG